MSNRITTRYDARQRPTTSTAGTSTTEKKQLPPPTTFGDLAVSIILHVCRKYLFYDMTYKIGFYVIFVTALSFVGDLSHMSRANFLGNKRNFLNDVFVKWGMLWTLGLLSPFVYYTSKVYSGDDRRKVRQQMARLIVSVVIWFLCTQAFVHVEKISGFCTKTAYPDRAACAVAGGRWYSFDISAHCFLLIYCCLMMEEETRVFRNWDRILSLMNRAKSDPPELVHLNEREKTVIKEQHMAYTVWIRILFLALTALHLFWDFMIGITSLYYHNWPQKIAAVAVAVTAWYATYGLWFKSARSPGMPGQAKLKYQPPPQPQANRSSVFY